MTKTFNIESITTTQSKLLIDLTGNHLVIEHIRDANSFDDDSSIFLTFNIKETKKLIDFYRVASIEELFNYIHDHFTTYNSLKRFKDFFDKRNIHSTISSSCVLTD
jgi:hypothetical protein